MSCETTSLSVSHLKALISRVDPSLEAGWSGIYWCVRLGVTNIFSLETIIGPISYFRNICISPQIEPL